MNTNPTYSLLFKFSCSLLNAVKRFVIFEHLKSNEELGCVCFKHNTEEIKPEQPAKNNFIVGFYWLLFPP